MRFPWLLCLASPNLDMLIRMFSTRCWQLTFENSTETRNIAMSLASTLALLRPTLASYIHLTKYGLIRCEPNTFGLNLNPKAPALAQKVASAMFVMGASSVIEGYIMSKMLSQGPKVCSFDALTCDALENFELNVSCTDYQQPFPSVVIELPQDYIKKRIVPFKRGTHSPDFAVVHHDQQRNVVMLIIRMSSHQVLTRLLKLELAPTMEEVWDMGKRSWGPEDSLAMTPEENQLGTAICKLALNVCLLATAYGVRCLGPDNPSHHQRLQRYAQLARKKGRERIEQADLDVLLMPMRYAFAEDVVLYTKEASTGHESNGVGGWTVSPHWRRGHWRWQPCGPGRSERRRIAIPSVLVNGHVLVGEAT